jgi:hypothetical protein
MREKETEADQQRPAAENRVKMEVEYLEQRNEELRVLVDPDGLEQHAAGAVAFTQQGSIFNGAHKQLGLKYAMDLLEVAPPAKNINQYLRMSN